MVSGLTILNRVNAIAGLYVLAWSLLGYTEASSQAIQQFEMQTEALGFFLAVPLIATILIVALGVPAALLWSIIESFKVGNKIIIGKTILYSILPIVAFVVFIWPWVF